MVLIPSPRHKLSHLLGPPHPLERDVLYGRPFSTKALYCTYKIIIHKDIYVQYTFSIYIYIYIYMCVHGSLVVKFAAARCQGPRFYLGQGRNLDRDFCSMRTTVPPLGKQLWV